MASVACNWAGFPRENRHPEPDLRKSLAGEHPATGFVIGRLGRRPGFVPQLRFAPRRLALGVVVPQPIEGFSFRAAKTVEKNHGDLEGLRMVAVSGNGSRNFADITADAIRSGHGS